jgi:hypothetical protein
MWVELMWFEVCGVRRGYLLGLQLYFSQGAVGACGKGDILVYARLVAREEGGG